MIPAWLRYGAVATLGGALTWYALARPAIAGREVTIAQLREARQTELQAAADAAYQASERYRATEQAWTTKLSEVSTDAETQRQAARAAAARADAADATAGRLRGDLDAHIAAIRRRAAEDPEAARSSEAAINSLDLLAQLFRRADRRAGELARYADEARIAGLACERAYDSLTP